jgi:hypothetical protein
MAYLKRQNWPEFGGSQRPPGAPSAAALEQRIGKTRQAAAESRFTHLVIYADREHFANLAWLTHFEPRFEEALLVMDTAGDKAPLLITGIECGGYLDVSPLWRTRALRHAHCNWFGLPDTPQKAVPALGAVLREEIPAEARVGVAGWKEYDDPALCDVPAYLLSLIPGAIKQNAAGMFTNPAHGLRARIGADEIAYFEWTNVEASEAMKRLMLALPEAVEHGWLDHQLAAAFGCNGLPLGCHWTLATGVSPLGLSSASGVRVERGNPLSTNVCYWGANCCRAAWIAASEADLPTRARGYVEQFAGPYFEAMAGWFERFRIGTAGAALQEWIDSQLPDHGIELNAGHLIHYDEWVSSPVYRGSAVKLASGMAFQADVIPASERFFSTRMEDTFVLADEALRDHLDPMLLARCNARREFMRGELGLPVSDDVLPLSNLAGMIHPFLLDPGVLLAR